MVYMSHRGRAHVALVLAMLIFVPACGEKDPPLVVDLDAAKNVAGKAETAFEVLLDAEAHAIPLELFLEATDSAATRAEMTAAWAGIAEDVGQAEDFLETKIFAKAEADGDWPEGQHDEKATFVVPVREAMRTFLGPEAD